jgi:hypothetical protein
MLRQGVSLFSVNRRGCRCSVSASWPFGRPPPRESELEVLDWNGFADCPFGTGAARPNPGPATADADAYGDSVHGVPDSFPLSGYLPRPFGRGDVPTCLRMSAETVLEVAMLV